VICRVTVCLGVDGSGRLTADNRWGDVEHLQHTEHSHAADIGVDVGQARPDGVEAVLHKVLHADDDRGVGWVCEIGGKVGVGVDMGMGMGGCGYRCAV
jgi:hypothetical protein